MSLIQPNPNEMIIKEMQAANKKLEKDLEMLAIWYQDPKPIEDQLNFIKGDCFTHLISRILVSVNELRSNAIELGYPWVAYKQKENKANKLVKNIELELANKFIFTADNS